MAINIITHRKWEQKQLEEEEEEEALSLCDLPDNSLDQQEDQPRKSDSGITAETPEEFDFYSWGGPVSKQPEMCAADEVFFKGQILPLHLSSKSTLSQHHSYQCEWRSESLDHRFSSEFQSNSSRSSSIRSQNSSSTASSTTTTTTTTRIARPRVQNQFHTHPIRRSSSWELFRIGVVPAPEIGLQDIKKVRSTNDANKISISSNSSINGTNFNANSINRSVKKSNKISDIGKSKNILKQLVGKSGGLFSGCKCSIETVQSGFFIIRSGSKSSNKTERTTHAVKEKVLELKRQNKNSHRIKQEKKAMSRLRTFEWINVHLHANYPDEEEALLSYS